MHCLLWKVLMVVLFFVGGAAALEEEYEEAIAMNVYLEMLFQKKEKESKHKNSFQKDKNIKKVKKSFKIFCLSEDLWVFTFGWKEL